jgi:hypothetical protein
VIGLLSNIKNSKYDGYKNNNIDPDVTLFSLTSSNPALTSQITLLKINLASAFLFTGSQTAPVLLG